MTVGHEKAADRTDRECSSRVPHIDSGRDTDDSAQGAAHHPERIPRHEPSRHDAACHAHQGIEGKGGEIGLDAVDVDPSEVSRSSGHR